MNNEVYFDGILGRVRERDTTSAAPGGSSTTTAQSSQAALITEDEGVNLTSTTASLNFAGAGVTATNVGNDVTVTIPGGGAATAAGTDTQVQFNDGGTNLGGDAGFTYNKTTDTATLGQLIDSGLTANTALTANASKQLTSSATTDTELGYVSGVTSAIQTQLNGKANKTDNLSVFAATTSLQLKGVISDETGSGALVFATSPNITTPTGIVKGDVGLGNVDNTSDATKNSAIAALTNKDLTSGTNSFPTFNQNTTGSAATLTTPRAIYGNNFDGSAALTQVIASTYGGTGNGFTKFTGPTTAEKTFTLPDASSTIVVQGGALGTPSSGTLTNATGLPIAGLTASTSTAIGVGSIELGHATDTTIARVGAGQISVEGVNVATISSTDTLTNKRVTPRITTITSSATPTINTDNCDAVTITALAAAITSMTTNLSGTPNNFDKLTIRIKDDGTARAIAWGTSFVAEGVALPTTTVISKVLTVGFIYDSVKSAWGCVAASQEI